MFNNVNPPDHEESKADTLRTVLQQWYGVFIVLIREDGGIIEDCGEEVDGGDGDQEEEGGLHQRTLADGFTQEEWPPHGQEDGSPGTVDHCLVEDQSLAPSDQEYSLKIKTEVSWYKPQTHTFKL